MNLPCKEAASLLSRTLSGAGLLSVALLCSGLLGASVCEAQSRPPVLLVVDAGEVRLNTVALGRAISRAIGGPVIRMTDARAPRATERLLIAHERPNRWVLRYESGDHVAWTSDRVVRPGTLRRRLARLAADLVDRVRRRRERPASERPRWSDEIILALHNEIIDPFEDLPPGRRLSRPRPVTLLWSEVVDPFVEEPQNATDAVWSEVLDPWAE